MKKGHVSRKIYILFPEIGPYFKPRHHMICMFLKVLLMKNHTVTVVVVTLAILLNEVLNVKGTLLDVITNCDARFTSCTIYLQSWSGG